MFRVLGNLSTVYAIGQSGISRVSEVSSQVVFWDALPTTTTSTTTSSSSTSSVVDNEGENSDTDDNQISDLNNTNTGDQNGNQNSGQNLVGNETENGGQNSGSTNSETSENIDGEENNTNQNEENNNRNENVIINQPGKSDAGSVFLLILFLVFLPAGLFYAWWRWYRKTSVGRKTISASESEKSAEERESKVIFFQMA